MRLIPRALKLVVATAVAFLLIAAPASASPPLQGSGESMITGLVVGSDRSPGASSNSIQERTLTGIVTSGPLAGGSFEQTVIGMVRPNGQVTFQGHLIYTGPVQGCGEEIHTLHLAVQAGHGLGGEPPEFPATRANVRVISDSDSTITGHGTIVQVGFSLSYDIRYRCG